MQSYRSPFYDVGIFMKHGFVRPTRTVINNSNNINIERKCRIIGMFQHGIWYKMPTDP